MGLVIFIAIFIVFLGATIKWIHRNRTIKHDLDRWIIRAEADINNIPKLIKKTKKD